MHKKLIAGLSVLAFALSISTAAFAGGGHGYHGKMDGGDAQAGMFFFKAHKVLKMQKELGLSAEQVETIRNLKLDMKKTLIRSQAEIDVLDIDLYSQFKNNPKDTAALNKLIDEQYDLKKNKTKALYEAYSKLTGTLNEKQLETLKASFESHKARSAR